MPYVNPKKDNFSFKKENDKLLILCQIRKKYIVLTPEEWVRQNVISFLLSELNCPISMINVEKKIIVNSTAKRYDIVVYLPSGNIFLVVECKAPSVSISQQTFDQIARYNLSLNANYLMVSNGNENYFCQMDYLNQKYIFLKTIPNYTSIYN